MASRLGGLGLRSSRRVAALVLLDPVDRTEVDPSSVLHMQFVDDRRSLSVRRVHAWQGRCARWRAARLQPGREQLSRRLGAQAHQSEMRAQLPRKAYEPLKLLRTNIVVVYGVCHLLCVCRRASCACRGTGERCEPKYEVMISCMKSRARNRVEKSCKPILEVVRPRFRAFLHDFRGGRFL